MTRYSDIFHRLSAAKQGAFVPFTVIGFPTVSDSVEIIQSLLDGGADALELGIPFSDPVADGPVIQAAGVKAIEDGCTPDRCFEVISKIRTKNADIPIGLLVYANLVVSNGIDAFYAKCEKAGVDSVLIADLPVYEAAPFIIAARKHGVSPVFIAPPNASDDTLSKIASMTEGYTYVVSRSGVTGVDKDVVVENKEVFSKLKKCGAPPSMQGFGISTPDHVKRTLLSGADGAIVGSAVVAKINDGRGDIKKLCVDLRTFVADMKAATRMDR
jgi:tryptophan synthase alpha chain